MVYDLRFGVNRATAATAGMKRQAHWGGRSTALRIDSVAVRFDMHFIRCAEELPYVKRFAAIMVRYADLCDEQLMTESLNYVPSLRPFGGRRLLTNVDCWLKITVFERCLPLKETNPLFVNFHCVGVFVATPASLHELFDKVP